MHPSKPVLWPLCWGGLPWEVTRRGPSDTKGVGTEILGWWGLHSLMLVAMWEVVPEAVGFCTLGPLVEVAALTRGESVAALAQLAGSTWANA